MTELGVKTIKVEGLEKEYIWPRGPEGLNLEDASLAESAPEGYYKLALATTEPPLHYTSLLEVETFPWPFPSGSVLDIKLGTYACQLRYLDKVMEEAYRVLVPNGRIQIRAPYYTSLCYFGNIRNITPITEDTFGYYSKKWCEAKHADHIHKCDFKPIGMKFFYTEEWILRADAAKDWARRHYWNVIEAVECMMEVIK